MRRRGPRDGVPRGERGLTMLELMVVCGIIALLAVIAIQNLLRARTTTNEAAAIGNLHALAETLHTYHAVNNVFPANWQTDLYTEEDPDYGPPAFNVAMDGSSLHNYLYTYTAQPGGCATNCTGYTIRANPQALGLLGTRAFFLDNTGRVRHCTGAGPADATDPLVTDVPVAC